MAHVSDGDGVVSAFYLRSDVDNDNATPFSEIDIGARVCVMLCGLASAASSVR
jgi:hypothetical protein